MTTDASLNVIWRQSLRFKLTAAALVIELLMLVLLLANSYRLVTNALETQTKASLEAISPLLGASLAGRVFQRDHAEIEHILRQLTDNPSTEMRYIAVLGPGDELLAKAGEVPAHPRQDSSILSALSDMTYDTHLRLMLGGVEIGSVRFGLSLRALAGLRENVLKQSLIIAGPLILLSLVLLLFLGYLLTRHIGILLEATRRVASGDYDTRLNVTARDEIGLLAEHFNTMAAALAHDAAERSRYQHELEFQAHHDALTQLPNRVLLGDRMRLAIARTQRSRRLLAIAYLDLDGFKPINDTLGHNTGDSLLTLVAQRLKDHTRAGDTVCRLGGDEFALLIGDLTSIEECSDAIERLLRAIAAPYPVNQRMLQVTASVGLTVYPLDDADADALLRHADQAMYVAKQSGRNRYHLFNAEQDRQVQVQRSQRARIEQALANNEFLLYYQPKVDMQSGKVVGVEALIRWQHPEAGLLAPARFLPEVEDTDFAIPLGEWVLDTALAQLARWREAALDIEVSVNIAARHLQSPSFAKHLEALLARYPDVNPAMLELEIVESAALEDVVRVARIIETCHALKVRFALDDFGTGYSSLSYFKRLRVDTLKIDQSFVRDLLTDEEDHAIVEGVISLTKTFRRRVIAEGVETAEIGAALLALDCTMAQGYGIARPMPARELPRWIATWRSYPQWGSNAPSASPPTSNQSTQ